MPPFHPRARARNPKRSCQLKKTRPGGRNSSISTRPYGSADFEVSKQVKSKKLKGIIEVLFQFYFAFCLFTFAFLYLSPASSQSKRSGLIGLYGPPLTFFCSS